MKTIEERAEEYAVKAWREIKDFDEDHVTFENIASEAYIAGAQSEHALLSEWRSPDDIPDTDRYVLIKINNIGDYSVGYYNIYDDSWHIPSFFETREFIGWREIHE